MFSSILNSALVSHYELALSLDLGHLICPLKNSQYRIHSSITTYTPTPPINFRLCHSMHSVLAALQIKVMSHIALFFRISHGSL